MLRIVFRYDIILLVIVMSMIPCPECKQETSSFSDCKNCGFQISKIWLDNAHTVIKVCVKCGSLFIDGAPTCDCFVEKESPPSMNVKYSASKYNNQTKPTNYEELRTPIEDRIISEPLKNVTFTFQAHSNDPKCPICNSKNLKKISTAKKATKISVLGIFGAGDLGKTWQCENCGSKF